MNVKELLENEEFMENIVEDITEIPEDSEVSYEVWALGYTCDEEMTDTEILVGEFTDPDAAIACAEKVSFKSLREAGYEEPDEETVYFSIEVETVVEDPEDEDGGTMNIGTIYSRELWIDNDCEEAGLGDYNNVVCLSNKDFEFLDDGTLKVSCTLLRDFNKNDLVIFEFVDEPQKTPLEYKIISKVIYEDGDYYHLDFIG